MWRTDLDGAVRADSTPRGLFASGQRQVARRYWRDSTRCRSMYPTWRR
ncbi:competence protein [Bordetella pertussis]|nr:competence protein [Bordetella pertussis]